MGVEKQIISPGNGTTYPRVGDKVTIEYTGYLFDPSKPGNKGNKFDSSIPRGPLVTQIGVGKVIRGWDEGVPTMSVGEQATLTISSDYAYGERGFPGHIPPNSVLVFDVQLKKIE